MALGAKSLDQEALDGRGVMLQHMIGVPTIDQFVETMILDVPSLVAESLPSKGAPEWPFAIRCQSRRRRG